MPTTWRNLPNSGRIGVSTVSLKYSIFPRKSCGSHMLPRKIQCPQNRFVIGSFRAIPEVTAYETMTDRTRATSQSDGYWRSGPGRNGPWGPST